jgi:cytochrome b561
LIVHGAPKEKMSSQPQDYSATAKALHWLIVVLVLSQFVVAVLMPLTNPAPSPQ